jgi:hypothetical protein
MQCILCNQCAATNMCRRGSNQLETRLDCRRPYFFQDDKVPGILTVTWRPQVGFSDDEIGRVISDTRRMLRSLKLIFVSPEKGSWDAILCRSHFHHQVIAAYVVDEQYPQDLTTQAGWQPCLHTKTCVLGDEGTHSQSPTCFDSGSDSTTELLHDGHVSH